MEAIFSLALLSSALVSLVIGLMWIAALMSVLKNNFEGNNKLVWFALLFLIAPVGAVLYPVIGLKQRI